MTDDASAVARLAAVVARIDEALAQAASEQDALAGALRCVERFDPALGQLFAPSLDAAGKAVGLDFSWQCTRREGLRPPPPHLRRVPLQAHPLPPAWFERPRQPIVFIDSGSIDPQRWGAMPLAKCGETIRSAALLPLFGRSDARCQGLLVLGWSDLHVPSEEERLVYLLVRQALGSALAHQRAERATRMTLNEISQFYALGDELNAAPTLAAALEAAALPVVSRGATAATLTVIERDDAGVITGALIAAAVDLEGSDVASSVGARVDVRADPLVALWVDDPGSPLLIDDVEEDTRVAPAARARLRAARQRAAAILPLVSRGRLIGALSLFWPAVQRFGERESRLYKRIARASATTVENRLLVQRMEVAMQIQQDLLASAQSTPLIPITRDIMVVPLIGSLEGDRGQRLMEVALEGARRDGIRVFIIDVTGARALDTRAAMSLRDTARALRLLGAQPVLTGIGAEAAKTLAAMGIRFDEMVVRSSLESGIAHALRITGRRPIE